MTLSKPIIVAKQLITDFLKEYIYVQDIIDMCILKNFSNQEILLLACQILEEKNEIRSERYLFIENALLTEIDKLPSELNSDIEEYW